MAGKRTLWLLLAELDNPEVCVLAPALAWLAEAQGATFEAYLETRRGGGLFAPTGSTVLGGKHHEQFNYLCAAFDVRALLLGDPRVFNSSLPVLGVPVLARAGTALALYGALAGQGLLPRGAATLLAPDMLPADGQEPRIGPYLFPGIYFRRALGLPARCAGEVSEQMRVQLGVTQWLGLYLTPEERAALPGLQEVDSADPGDDYGSLTLRIAERWKGRAQGVVFGDPPAVLSQVAAHCRRQRVPVFAPLVRLPAFQVKYSAYTEETWAIAPEVTRLANEIGNPVIMGRQTSDGDLFE